MIDGDPQSMFIGLDLDGTIMKIGLIQEGASLFFFEHPKPHL